ncbi:MAG TPA: lipopolysaccharide biosynthesis protein [Jatrophihabitans sp.]|jgi:PST family polysaccharide transporter
MTEPEQDASAGADPLGQLAARGALVSLAGQLGRVVVQFVGLVVLARLLDPRDYGLLAIAIVVIGIGEIVRDFGLTTAAVQAPTLSQEQRSALFWINVAIGATATVVVVAAAPLVTTFFDDPDVVPFLRVCALTFLVNGLATQYRANLTREMRFGRLVTCDLAGQIVGATVGITLAALGAGYWALVALQVGQYSSVLILLVVVSHWRPSRPRRRSGVGPLVRFGGHLVTTQLIYYLGNNLDTLAISVRFTPAALGIYNRAFAMIVSPLNQIRTPATTVALPVLSRIGDDYDTAGRYLQRAQLALGYSVGPALALCAGASGALVQLMLGTRWAAAAPLFAMFALAGAASILAFPGLWTYLSRGMGADLMRYTLFTLGLQAVCVIGGSTWGVEGVAAGYLVASLVEWPLSLFWLSRLTVIPLGALARAGARITGCSAVVGLASFSATRLVADHAAPSALCLAVLAGVLAGGLTVLVPQVRSDLRQVLAFGRLMLRRAPGPAVEPQPHSSTSP